MLFSLRAIVSIVLTFLVFSLATAYPSISFNSSIAEGKPAAFLLAGDSTTAKGGGWGDGFLTFLEKPAIGTNYGRGGRTTVSFKSGGYWGKVMEDVKKYAGSHQVYVTIQFGHNDQKKDAGISIQDFQRNLAAMAAEVKSAGGTPILTTPLTRRTFQGPKVVENLAEQKTATIAAAKGGSYASIDLNAASTRFINAIGQTAANKYNLAEKDYTHLNEHGGVVFGRMVADLIIERFPNLGGFFKKNEAMSSAIKAGKPV